MGQYGEQMGWLGARMNQLRPKWIKLRLKWVNLGTNGSTWVQIGQLGLKLALLVKLMVQLRKLGFQWPNFCNPTIHLIPQFIEKLPFHSIFNFFFVIFSDNLPSKIIHATTFYLLTSIHNPQLYSLQCSHHYSLFFINMS